MKTHKQRTKSQIIDTFMEEVEQSQQIPTSISDFCLINHIEEENFNAYFDSIKALEAEIYAIFFQNTLELLRTDEAYLQFEAKEKVLTFYYTFFEILNANNVYVKTSLTNKNVFSKILVFKTLRESYTQYIKTLQHDYLTIPLEVLENAKSNLILFLYAQING